MASSTDDQKSSNSEQLLMAHGHVWNQIFNFINSMSVKCAIQLGLFDKVHKHGKPMTLSELIHALPINMQKSHGVERLMRILIHSKLFVKVSITNHEQNEGYWLTPASRLLLKDNPSSIAPFALAMLDPLLIDPWHHLGEWFRNDTPTAFASVHGKEFWEFAGTDPRMNRFFNQGMASDAHFVATMITRDNCKNVFEGLTSIVDVGGGTGTVAKIIGDAFPGLKCIVLDLPHVVAGLEGTHNLTFISGDMFDSVPADAVFLKWILHDWSDEECIKILMKCKEAIPEKENGGKGIIIDMVVATEDEIVKEDEAIETQIFFDMLMMTLVTGKERTEKQWRELFLAAGFKTYKITPCLGVRSLIEIFP